MRRDQQQNEPPIVVLYGCIVFVFVFALLCAAIISGAL